jgi:hypothetical protein
MAQDPLPTLELFAHCTRGHRACVVYYDETGRHQAPFVHMFTLPGVSRRPPTDVYRVTCPTCGEDYTAFGPGLERVRR